MIDLLASLFKLVLAFGYIVIPIEQLDEEIKKQLNISLHKVGEVVIVSRMWIVRGEQTAKNLGDVLDKHAVTVNNNNSVIVYVVKQRIRRKKLLKDLVAKMNKTTLHPQI